MDYVFPHERLDVYRLAVKINHDLRDQKWPRGLSSIRDQAVRASASVALNIAEANGRRGDARLNHLRIALGSLYESAAVVDIALHGDVALKRPMARCAMMLKKLIQRG